MENSAQVSTISPADFPSRNWSLETEVFRMHLFQPPT